MARPNTANCLHASRIPRRYTITNKWGCPISKRIKQSKTKSKKDARTPSQEELRAAAEAIAGSVSLEKKGTELVLVEVEPHRAHAYWNIDLADFEEIRERCPDQPMVLRIYDVTDISFDGGNANQVFDVEVQGLHGKWYVDLWRNNRTFLADLGLRTADGGLQLLARSNEIHTPPAEPALETGQEGLDVSQPKESGGPAPTRFPAAKDESRNTPADTSPDTADSGNSAEETPSEPAPGESMTTDTPDELQYYPDAGTPSEQKKAAGAGDAVTQWPSGEELARHVTGSAGDVPGYESPPASQPEPGSEPAPLATPAGPSPLPLESFLTQSAPGSGNRDVLLEVNAELHVYGRAKPDTELTLYGQAVRTRPDGTFSVRRPLPHGALFIPIRYTGPDAGPPGD